MAETTKLVGEMRADRTSAHSSAISDSHESVLTAPEGADTPAPEGALSTHASFRGSRTIRLRRSQ
jgi:hypothetical protein